jgi:tetratricopeptide (TPR) repeat protein
MNFKVTIRRLYALSFVCLVFITGHSQTPDVKAKRYYIEGVDKILRKNYKDAIVDLSWAIKRDSGFLEAYENRGVAKYYLKDYSGSIEDFNKALEINPVDFNTYGRRGWARFHLQDNQGAIEDFTKAIEGGWRNYKYYNIRGRAKYYLQDYKGAISDFTKVIRLCTGEKDERRMAFYWRGMVKIDLGQRADGCKDLKRAGKLGYAIAFEIMEIYCNG